MYLSSRVLARSLAHSLARSRAFLSFSSSSSSFFSSSSSSCRCHTTAVTSLLPAAAQRNGTTFSVVFLLLIACLCTFFLSYAFPPSFCFRLSSTSSFGSLSAHRLHPAPVTQHTAPRCTPTYVRAYTTSSPVPSPWPYVLTRVRFFSFFALPSLAPTSAYQLTSPCAFLSHHHIPTTRPSANPVESSRRFFALSHRLLH